MAVVFERANVAVSTDPLGTVTGLQFVLVFQSPERGVTLPCYAAGLAGLDAKHQDKRAEIAVTSGSGVFMGSRRVARGVQPCPAFISLIS